MFFFAFSMKRVAYIERSYNANIEINVQQGRYEKYYICKLNATVHDKTHTCQVIYYFSLMKPKIFR